MVIHTVFRYLLIVFFLSLSGFCSSAAFAQCESEIIIPNSSSDETGICYTIHNRQYHKIVLPLLVDDYSNEESLITPVGFDSCAEIRIDPERNSGAFSFGFSRKVTGDLPPYRTEVKITKQGSEKPLLTFNGEGCLLEFPEKGIYILETRIKGRIEGQAQIDVTVEIDSGSVRIIKTSVKN